MMPLIESGHYILPSFLAYTKLIFCNKRVSLLLPRGFNPIIIFIVTTNQTKMMLMKH